MTDRGAGRIEARIALGRRDAWQVGKPNRDRGKLLVCKVIGDLHRLEAGGFVEFLVDAVDVVWIELEKRGIMFAAGPLYPRGSETPEAGMFVLRASSFEEAEAIYRRGLEVKPDSAEVHNNLGIVLHIRGKLEDAAAAYRRALELKPDYAEAHNNLGSALKLTGQMPAAMACFRQAVALDPKYADGFSNLGVVLAETGQVDEALKQFAQALALQPDLIEAHSNRGVALHAMMRLEAAFAGFERAIALRPDFAHAHYSEGLTRLLIGDPARVIAGTDCGFSTSIGASRVAGDIAWAKIKSLAEGARLASERLRGA